MDRQNSKIFALIGGVLLALGVFLPLVRVPKLGTISFMNNGSTEGIIVLLLAGAVIALALLNQTRHAVWPGLAALAMVGFAFVRIQSRLGEARERAAAEAGDNPFAGIAEAAAGSIQLEYGWAVLAFGALLAIGGGVLAWRRG